MPASLCFFSSSACFYSFFDSFLTSFALNVDLSTSGVTVYPASGLLSDSLFFLVPMKALFHRPCRNLWCSFSASSIVSLVPHSPPRSYFARHAARSKASLKPSNESWLTLSGVPSSSRGPSWLRSSFVSRTIILKTWPRSFCCKSTGLRLKAVPSFWNCVASIVNSSVSFFCHPMYFFFFAYLRNSDERSSKYSLKVDWTIEL